MIRVIIIDFYYLNFRRISPSIYWRLTYFYHFRRSRSWVPPKIAIKSFDKHIVICMDHLVVFYSHNDIRRSCPKRNSVCIYWRIICVPDFYCPIILQRVTICKVRFCIRCTVRLREFIINVVGKWEDTYFKAL